MKKRLTATLLLLAVLLCAPTTCLERISFLSSPVVVEAASKTITVKKANKATANAVHKQLYAKKALTLKVKGNRDNSYKLLLSLEKQVQKANGQAILFDGCYVGQHGNYSYYEVSKDDAKEYFYANKFVKKIYKNARTRYNSIPKKITSALNADIKKYSKESTRKHRIVYDMCVRLAKEHPAKAYRTLHLAMSEETVPFYVKGGDKQTCNIVGHFKDITLFQTFIRDQISSVVKSEEIAEDGSITLTLNSFKEFKQNVNSMRLENIPLWNYYFSTKEATYKTSPYYFKDPKSAFKVAYFSKEQILYKAKNFCDLSDAMKIWVIDASDYFGCHFSKVPFGMVYDASGSNTGSGWVAFKNMYDNNVRGVCSDYARMEYMLFSQLGITCYCRTNFTICHEWTVVKVKNAKGKTLWIPFDYGIGPADGLMTISESAREAISTEEKRYRLYLAGIPGAPSKKNFKNSDFV